jgi:hypothetical protein
MPSKRKMRPTTTVACTQIHFFLSLPHIPYSIIVLEYMLGCVPNLKYAEHDVKEVTKFP